MALHDTELLPAPAFDRSDRFRARRFLMCSPTYFDVTYSINPWMHPDAGVDQRRAQRQWDELVTTYEALGHRVELIDPVPGLPDMVFTANAGLVLDGHVFEARFRHPQRRGEEAHFRSWFRTHGYTARAPQVQINEGEGDFLVTASCILAGTGFRSSGTSHDEVRAYFHRPLVGLRLVDPRFYHLDTALAVLDAERDEIMYYPGAFSPRSQRELAQRFPDAVVATEADAVAFGLNAMSDGQHVVLGAGATGLATQLRACGYEPVPVDISELTKAGGGAKCCTLELRDRAATPASAVTPTLGPVAAGPIDERGPVVVRLADHRDGSQRSPGREDPPAAAASGASTAAADDAFVARNYHPLPVSIVDGEGAWVTGSDGERYLDLLAAYSALNFGHRHPRLLAAAHAQLDRVTLTSRAFGNDRLGPFCRELAGLCRKDMVLAMNTGAEAVETGIKLARRWGYLHKGVPRDDANIVVCDGNFHGRTTTIVGFSTDPTAQEHFGPFTPGFRSVPFGDAEAMARAIDERTVAVLLEPIQGEAGVIVPPDGYLRAVRDLCDDLNVLFVADEIQSGLGRTGATFACDHEGVVPDVYLLGKALGGGVVPVSAVVADREVMEVFTPGSHGSTFGGNPLACAVAGEVVAMLQTGEHQARARELGAAMHTWLAELQRQHPLVVSEVRGRGLWAGIDFSPRVPSGRDVCERLLDRRVLVKDTHDRTIRLAPPLVISEGDLRWAVEQVEAVVATYDTGGASVR